MNGNKSTSSNEREKLLFIWKEEANEAHDVSFQFGEGFGCGAAVKRSHGERFALQTQYTFSSQITSNLSTLGTGIGSNIGSGISETLTHELSLSSEWGYTSRPCEYCHPRVHFPNAQVKSFKRYFLHLPLFVVRKTVFVPGEPCEIKAHCKHNPEECGNCDDTQVSSGAGSVLAVSGTGGPTHLERVMIATRTPSHPPSALDLKEFLKGIVSVPNEKAAPEQVYTFELDGKIQAVHRLDGHYALYSIDDIDRTLDAVRIGLGANSLFFLTKQDREQPAEETFPRIELIDEKNDSPPIIAKPDGAGQHGRFRLIRAYLSYPNVDTIPEEQELKLSLRSGDNFDEWPAILVRAGV